MSNRTKELLAAAEGTSAVTTDLIDAARAGGEVKSFGNIGIGDTLVQLVDSLRLLTLCMPEIDDDTNRLYHAAVKFLEDRT